MFSRCEKNSSAAGVRPVMTGFLIPIAWNTLWGTTRLAFSVLPKIPRQISEEAILLGSSLRGNQSSKKTLLKPSLEAKSFARRSVCPEPMNLNWIDGSLLEMIFAASSMQSTPWSGRNEPKKSTVNRFPFSATAEGLKRSSSNPTGSTSTFFGGRPYLWQK